MLTLKGKVISENKNKQIKHTEIVDCWFKYVEQKYYIAEMRVKGFRKQKNK